MLERQVLKQTALVIHKEGKVQAFFWHRCSHSNPALCLRAVGISLVPFVTVFLSRFTQWTMLPLHFTPATRWNDVGFGQNWPLLPGRLANVYVMVKDSTSQPSDKPVEFPNADRVRVSTTCQLFLWCARIKGVGRTRAYRNSTGV